MRFHSRRMHQNLGTRNIENRGQNKNGDRRIGALGAFFFLRDCDTSPCSQDSVGPLCGLGTIKHENAVGSVITIATSEKFHLVLLLFLDELDNNCLSTCR